MTISQLLNEVCKSLGLPEGSVVMTDSQSTIDEWDSLGHLALVAMLHEKFPLDGSDEKLRSFRSVEDLVSRLTELNLVVEE